MTKIIFLFLSVIGLSALAQVPAPTPAPTPSGVILDLLGLVKSWGSMGIYAAIAAALKLLVDSLKAFGLWEKIPAVLQSTVVVLFGLLTVGLTTLAAGGTAQMALAAAVGSSGVAMLFHEWLDDILPWVKEKLYPPKMEVPPPTEQK